MRKQEFCICETKAQISCAVTAQLISAFVFPSRIVKLFLLLNPKFQAASLFPETVQAQGCAETLKTGFLVLLSSYVRLTTRSTDDADIIPAAILTLTIRYNNCQQIKQFASIKPFITKTWPCNI